MTRRTLPQAGGTPHYFVYSPDEFVHIFRNRLRNFCDNPSTLAPHAR